MRKILFVLNSNGVGGAEALIKSMCNSYFTNADVVTLWGHENKQADFWAFEHSGEVRHCSDKPLSLGVLVKVTMRLIRIIKENNYSVIQSQLKGADIIIGLLSFCRVIPNTKLVCIIHNNFDFYYGGGIVNRCIGKLHTFLIKYFFDEVVVISKQDLPKFRKKYQGKLNIIENGVDIEKFKNSKIKFNTVEKIVKVAFVGNVKHRKGYDLLLEYAESMDNMGTKFELNIAGSIEDQSIVEALSKLNLDNVSIKFLGKVANIKDFLASNDIFMSLARVEGLPISILEAMAAGLPVFLSDIPAHELILSDDLKGCCLFNSSSQFATNLQNFIKLDLLAIADSQMKHLEDYYSIERMCSDYDNLYKKEVCEEIN